MLSENSIGQPTDDRLDNWGAQNGPQAKAGDQQHIGGGEQESVAPAATPRELWANIPQALRERRQWCLAGTDKRPLRATGGAASSTDPATWSDFDTACEAAEAKGLRIGYVLSKDDPFTCIDMDVKDAKSLDKNGNPHPPSSLTTGEQLKLFQGTVEFAESYTELSTSGTGLHIWVLGNPGPGKRSKGIEVYSQERFIVCTGDTISSVKYHRMNGVVIAKPERERSLPIADGTNILRALASELSVGKPEHEALPDEPATLSDQQVLERAFAAGNATRFQAHWEADWDAINHTDHSKADMALVQMLAFYTPNNEQLTRLFLQSKLGERSKARDRVDYLPGTIQKARQHLAGDRASNDKHVEHGRQVAKGLLESFERQQEEQREHEKAQAKSRIKVSFGGELAKRPPARWRIKNIIPEQGFAAVYGPPGCGKSFLILDMLAHIHSGENWFDHKVKQAPVAYVAFEGAHGIPSRVKAFQKDKWALDQMCFIEAPGISLINPVDRDLLIETLREYLLTGGVLCIDTLAASAPGIDENSSEGMGKLISELQIIQQEVGGCAIVVHHTGKDRERGLRGWSGLQGALDAAIEVARDNKGCRSWTLTKAKDGEDGIGAPFSLKQVFLAYDEDGDTVTSCVVAPVEKRDAIDHATLAAEDDNFVWDWIRKEVEAGKFPSGRSLDGQREQMKPQRDLTQKQLRDATARLVAEGRLLTERNKGNPWYKAV